MAKIVPSHPYLVADYQDMILSSVSDQDISIRMRALDLVSAMVNKHNLQPIVQQILSHLVADGTSSFQSAAQSLTRHTVPSAPSSARISSSPSQSPAYRLVLCQRILAMCSASTYENVQNFEWYLSVLVDLAHIANVDIGREISDQLVDVIGRVRGVRRYAVRLMYALLSDETMIRNAREEGSCSEVLWAAGWICGEYCEYVTYLSFLESILFCESELAEPEKLLPYLLQPQILNLTPDIMSVYIQAATKIFGSWAADIAQRWENDHVAEVRKVVQSVTIRLEDLISSPHIEVQERVCYLL